MAKFVMLTTLTDEGRKTIKENPERIKEVNKEVAAMGMTRFVGLDNRVADVAARRMNIAFRRHASLLLCEG